MHLSPAHLSAFFISEPQLTILVINLISWTPFHQPVDVTVFVLQTELLTYKPNEQDYTSFNSMTKYQLTSVSISQPPKE